MSVSSCRCCMLVYLHPVAVVKAVYNAGRSRKSAIISSLIKEKYLHSDNLKKTIGLLQTCNLFQNLLKKLLLPKYIVI